MAVTAIWSRKGRVSELIAYASDRDKTDKGLFTKEERDTLRKIIDYTVDDSKTEKRFYTSGINCMVETAAEEMRMTKVQFGKTGGIAAYHGYQSFAPGESDPKTVHEIGVKLARKLWGNDYQVIVATHLDHEHLHNHFVFNSVSFRTGEKYRDTLSSYYRMREASDELCREYGLSVVNEMSGRPRRSYTEWKAEKEGKPTFRSLIRDDIDRAVLHSITYDDFMTNMAALGYEIKGYKDGLKYAAVRPEGGERFIRLTTKSLGYGYGEDEIRRRIETGMLEHRNVSASIRIRRRPFVNVHTLKGLYQYYMREMNDTRNDISISYQYGSVPFPVREEFVKFDRFKREYDLILNNGIETDTQLKEFKSRNQAKAVELYRTIKDMKENGTQHSVITSLQKKLRDINYDIRICDDILKHSEELSRMARDVQMTEQTALVRRPELNLADRGKDRPGRNYSEERS